MEEMGSFRARKTPGEKMNLYIKLCKQGKKFIKTKGKVSPKVIAAVDFLGWELTPEEIEAGKKYVFLITLLPAFFVLLITYGVYVPGLDTLVFMISQFIPPEIMSVLGIIAPLFVMLPILMYYWFDRYPIKKAEEEKSRVIITMPEIVNYMAMYLKLTPNLERAIEFAAEHGKGPIVEDLKRITWGLRTGEYTTAEEGLDEIAYKWGKYSPEFKRALMIIRGSIIETDEAKRDILLEKAVKELTEGIKRDMEVYIEKMRTPSVYLYYAGILLPLMLIVLLPVGAMFAQMEILNIFTIAFLYNVLIPLVVYYIAKGILSKKPEVFEAPKIPKNHPELPKKGMIKIGKRSYPVGFLAAVVSGAVLLLFLGFLEPTLNPPDITKQYHVPYFTYMGIILAAILGVSIYLYGITKDRRNFQKKIMELEEDFQDSIYVLASRLGEGKPLEEALRYTYEFFEETPGMIKDLFKKTYDNVIGFGMTLKSALFDPTYGSLRNIPSDIIKTAFRIVVDSIGLGAQQAAKSLISLSLQIKDSQELRRYLRKLLLEITSTMKVVMIFIAPVILGITVSLQKMMLDTVQSIGQTSLISGVGETSTKLNLPFKIGGGVTVSIDFMQFILISLIYLIEIIILLTYFTTYIEEGRNKLAFKNRLAKNLPVATTLYIIVAYVSGVLVGAI